MTYWEEAVISALITEYYEDPKDITKMESSEISCPLGKTAFRIIPNKEDIYTIFEIDSTLLRLTSKQFQKIANKDQVHCIYYWPHIFRELLKHIFMCSTWKYDGNLENACNLMLAAKEFGIADLFHNVHNHIWDLLTSKDATDALDRVPESEMYHIFEMINDIEEDHVCCGDLRDFVLKYIARKAQCILTQDSFEMITESALIEILDCDNLEVDSELDVFKAVIRWAQYSLKMDNCPCTTANLRLYLTDLMDYIRFPNMSTFELQNYVEVTELLTYEQLMLVKRSHYNLVDDSEEVPWSRTPRKYRGRNQDERIPLTKDILQAEIWVSSFKCEVSISELRFWLHQESKKKPFVTHGNVTQMKNEILKVSDDYKMGLSQVNKALEAERRRTANLQEFLQQLSASVSSTRTELYYPLKRSFDQLNRRVRYCEKMLMSSAKDEGPMRKSKVLSSKNNFHKPTTTSSNSSSNNNLSANEYRWLKLFPYFCAMYVITIILLIDSGFRF